MAVRGELVVLGLAVALLGGVGVMVVQARHNSPATIGPVQLEPAGDAASPAAVPGSDQASAPRDVVVTGSRTLLELDRVPLRDPTALHPKDLMGLLEMARHFLGLGQEQLYTLAKLMTMSAADFVEQWFESEPLKATLSASGIIGTFLGPRSPGTAYVLLHHYMGEIDGAFRAWGFAKNGTGGVTAAIASSARALGVEIRTGAAVHKVVVRSGRAAGVALDNGSAADVSVFGHRATPAVPLFDRGSAGRATEQAALERSTEPMLVVGDGTRDRTARGRNRRAAEQRRPVERALLTDGRAGARP